MKEDFSITDFNLEFTFPKTKDPINEIIKRFSQSNFQLEKISDLELRFQRIGELFPRMTLRDEKRALDIDLTSSKFTISISSPYTLSKDEDKKLKIFDKEELVKYNVDVNYILGSLMSALSMQTLSAEINITFESEKFKFNFDHLLSNNITLGKDSKTNMTGIQLESMNDIFGSFTKITYEFMNDEDIAEGYISFKQDITLPIQIDQMIYSLKDHFNSV